MKFLHLIALFVIAFTVCNAAENCHFRNFENCMAGIAGLSTNLQASNPVDKAGVDEQCFAFKEMNSCLQNYVKKCTTPLIKEVLITSIDRYQEYVDRFCDADGDLRTNELQEAD